MSKKYKGKICVYCADAVSVTGDHVFAREFFLENQRDNLPQVPACEKCNNRKSVLEHYLTSVLPFGGMHAQAEETLKAMMPKRLAANKKLHRVMRDGLIHLEDNGSSKGGLLPMEGDAVTQLFEFITKGLSWFHWGTIIEKTSVVSAMALTKAGVAFFLERFFALNAKARVENTLGDRVFSYTGVQAVDTDQITVWLFEAYAGLRMTDRNDIEDYSNVVGVVTNPSSLEERVASAFGLHGRT
jgi:hypothetical protein